jgi:hypothetical protein
VILLFLLFLLVVAVGMSEAFVTVCSEILFVLVLMRMRMGVWVLLLMRMRLRWLDFLLFVVVLRWPRSSVLRFRDAVK